MMNTWLRLYTAVLCHDKLIDYTFLILCSTWKLYIPVVWLVHLSNTSGALNPGVPALGATCGLLHVHIQCV